MGPSDRGHQSSATSTTYTHPHGLTVAPVQYGLRRMRGRCPVGLSVAEYRLKMANCVAPFFERGPAKNPFSSSPVERLGQRSSPSPTTIVMICDPVPGAVWCARHRDQRGSRADVSRVGHADSVVAREKGGTLHGCRLLIGRQCSDRVDTMAANNTSSSDDGRPRDPRGGRVGVVTLPRSTIYSWSGCAVCRHLRDRVGLAVGGLIQESRGLTLAARRSCPLRRSGKQLSLHVISRPSSNADRQGNSVSVGQPVGS